MMVTQVGHSACFHLRVFLQKSEILQATILNTDLKKMNAGLKKLPFHLFFVNGKIFVFVL